MTPGLCSDRGIHTKALAQPRAWLLATVANRRAAVRNDASFTKPQLLRASVSLTRDGGHHMKRMYSGWEISLASGSRG
jgi:hypothetical protein